MIQFPDYIINVIFSEISGRIKDCSNVEIIFANLIKIAEKFINFSFPNSLFEKIFSEFFRMDAYRCFNRFFAIWHWNGINSNFPVCPDSISITL